ncbi:TraX protein [Chlamydia trachomatis]|nr:TraX protein [Chlamydia trachomatis]CRH91178.1 TraX protein [Chlamydia trachomatis]
MLGFLILSALISELPFDLATYGQVEWVHQNIFTTFVLLFVILMGIDWAIDKFRYRSIPIVLLLSVSGIVLSEVFSVDFGFYGIGLGLIFYFGHKGKFPALLRQTLGYLLFLKELSSIFSFLALLFYNGQRGKQSKWFNYSF